VRLRFYFGRRTRPRRFIRTIKEVRLLQASPLGKGYLLRGLRPDGFLPSDVGEPAKAFPLFSVLICARPLCRRVLNVLLVPMLFTQTAKHSWKKILSGLSYPIFLCH
jgi:hypothetical protein